MRGVVVVPDMNQRTYLILILFLPKTQLLPSAAPANEMEAFFREAMKVHDNA